MRPLYVPITVLTQCPLSLGLMFASSKSPSIANDSRASGFGSMGSASSTPMPSSPAHYVRAAVWALRTGADAPDFSLLGFMRSMERMNNG